MAIDVSSSVYGAIVITTAFVSLTLLYAVLALGLTLTTARALTA